MHGVAWSGQIPSEFGLLMIKMINFNHKFGSLVSLALLGQTDQKNGNEGVSFLPTVRVFKVPKPRDVFLQTRANTMVETHGGYVLRPPCRFMHPRTPVHEPAKSPTLVKIRGLEPTVSHQILRTARLNYLNYT